MPMFFFHILQADGATSTDDIGSEFADVELAREEASRALHEMAMDIRSISGVTLIQIDVTDESGRTVARRRAVFEAEDLPTPSGDICPTADGQLPRAAIGFRARFLSHPRALP